MVLSPDEFNISTYKRWIEINQPLYSLRGSTQEQDKILGLDLNLIGDPKNAGDKDCRGKIRPRF